MPIAALIASQRSGTHYLRSLLDGHDLIEAGLDEVFHVSPKFRSCKDNFWNYLRHRSEAEPDSWLPWRRVAMFRDYTAFIEERHPCKTVLLDLKYNSLHHGSGSWQSATAEPAILVFLRERRTRVIHLQRRNVLKTVISCLRANAAGQHVVQTPDENRTAAIHIDPATAIHWMNAFRAESAFIARMLKPNPLVMDVFYEDLWLGPPGGERNTPLEAAILEHLGAATPAFGMVFPAKMTPDNLREAVINHDELCRALRNTPDAWMLDEADSEE